MEAAYRAGARVGARGYAEGGRREACGSGGGGNGNAGRTGSHQEGKEGSGRRRRRRGRSQAKGGEDRKGRKEEVARHRVKVYAAHCRTWESRSGVSVDAA